MIDFKNLNLMTDQQKELIDSINNIKATFPQDKTLVELFNEQVLKNPENVAISFNQDTLTYRELHSRSNQVAQLLNSLGINKGDIVPIMIERSLECYVSILGILKAGAVYLPLNEKLPKNRIKYIINDSQANTVITKSAYMNFLEGNELYLIVMDELLGFQKAKKRTGRVFDKLDLDIMTHNNVSIITKPNDLAYIIYTSGSTGLPKGVMVEHTSVVNLIDWIKKEFSLTQHSRVMQNAALFFDASIQMMFSALTCGATLYPTPDDIRIIPSEFIKWTLENKITHWDSVPSLWYQVTEYLEETDDGKFHFPHLNAILLAGEPLYVDKINTWREKVINNHDIYNIYGPTEATVNTTFYKVSENEQGSILPIGKPLQNMEVYILSKDLQLCLPNVIGEIFIGGVGVARGYLNNKELSSKSFIENPLPNKNGRLYRTGDFGRLLPTGHIEFVGRKDEQIKINGQRIEIFEIEAAIRDCKGIKNAAVIYKKLPNQNKGTLVGFYSSEKDEISLERLRDELKDKVPEYMIPNKFIEVIEFPYNSNKKIDKKALEMLLDQDNDSNKYIPPNTTTERLLASIWKEVLGVENISKNDDFFSIGGDSVSSILVRHKCEQQGIGIKNVDLFKYSRLDVLSSYIDENKNKLIGNKTKVKDHSILLNEIQKSKLPAGIEAVLPILPMQKAMLFVNKTNEAVDTPYIIQSKFQFKGPVCKEAFEKAFNVITSRHQALRTIFKIDIFDEAVQVILDESLTKVKWHNLEKYTKEEQCRVIREKTNKIREEGFNLQSKPPLRVDVFVKSDGLYDVLWTIHHIIVDGWSSSIIMREFMQAYNGFIYNKFKPLPQLEICYKDYINERLSIDNTNAKTYWKKYLQGVKPTILPNDMNREQTKQFGRVNLTISSEITKNLKNLAGKMNSTLNNICLAAYSIMLNQVSSQNDILFGLVTSGRSIPVSGIEKTVGCLINTIPLRIQFNNAVSGKHIAEEIKGGLNDIREYEHLDFSEIRKLVSHLRGKELIETVFLFQNYPSAKESIEYLNNQMKLLNTKETEDTHYPLTVVCTEDMETGGMNITFKYSRQQYHEKTVNKWADLLLESLSHLINQFNEPISKWNWLSKEDSLIWKEFNNTSYLNKPISIVDKFEQVANKYSNSIAIKIEDKLLTYKDLRRQANQLANLLNSRGIEEEDVVLVVCSRNHNLYKSILGTLKSGGAYVPVEPEFPIERMLEIIKDSLAKVVIGEQEWFEKNKSKLPKELDYIVVDGTMAINGRNVWNAHSLSLQEEDYPLIDYNPKATSYYIYTSGSTGKPKGVKISQESLVNFIDWYISSFNVSNNSQVSQNASICFDASVQGVFSALTTGATLLPIPEDIRRDSQRYLEWLEINKITHLDAVPSHWAQLLEVVEEQKEKANLRYLEWIVLGGESLDYSQTFRWKQKVKSLANIVHVYGPTEATVNATWHIVDLSKSQGKVPIGVPLPNYQIYVLNPYGSLSPVGIFGEIFIGGKGIAKGYTNLEETQKSYKMINGERLYKTGDIGRLVQTDEGDIYLEFSHRIDEQVKINGYRIELEEIESVVKSYSEIINATTLIKEHNSHKQVICLYVAKTECEKHLKSYVRNKLPLYMLPSTFIRLEEMPLTTTKKVDKKQLEEIVIEQMSKVENNKQRDLTELQRDLLRIWREELMLEVRDITDNFFEIGGNSLLAMNLLSKLKKIVSEAIKLADLYSYPSIEAFSQEIESRVRGTDNSNDSGRSRDKTSRYGIKVLEDNSLEGIISKMKKPFKVRKGEFYSKHSPLTAATLRKDKFIKSQTYLTLKFNSTLDIEKLSNAIYKIIDTHTLLHCCVDYDIEGNSVFKKVIFENWELPFLDLYSYNHDSQIRIKEELNKFYYMGFEVTEGPLFRIVLVREAENEYQLYWWFSHLITDGESIRIISQQLREYYEYGKFINNPGREEAYINYVKEFEVPNSHDLEVESKRIKKYIHATNYFNRFINTVRTSKPAYFEKTVQLDIGSESNLSSVIKNIYSLSTNSLAKWSKCNEVFFLELSHGRHINGKAYFNTVGNFVDYRPILNSGNSEYDEFPDNYRGNSINYGYLIQQLYESKKYNFLAKKILDIKYPLYFNFIEDRSFDEDTILQTVKHDEKYQEQLAGSIHFQIVRKGEKILFTLIGYGIRQLEMEKLWIDLNNRIREEEKYDIY